ncbi:hypothetical protein HSX10_17640 [Winogradskyella undariae]|jgi:hypothetical protein|uniref:hypothetical protein n=1 Tax=Winogradskyella undariae TaxID=1285465 RepID=UPI00156A9B4F|nr:hypothetical protein [Winogradskyella undariae]NRR93401.1 hypothetical protein [Winogradskyella undariae]
MLEDLVKKHREILSQNNVKNINLSISALYCEQNIDEIEKSITECNKALLGKPFDKYLPCPGEGWSVDIDPEEIGDKIVEIEFIYANNLDTKSIVPLWLFKLLLSERYHHINR